MQTRLLLLTAAFGSGHTEAARSIARACLDLDPDHCAHVVNLDRGLLQLGANGYLTLLQRAPGIYRSLYHAPVGAGTRALIRAVVGARVEAEITRFQPTTVVATHPFPGLAAAHLRRQGRLRSPVAMVITDFVPHPLWVHPGVDLYFVASSDAARRLQAMAVKPEQIRISGIPIRPEFGISAPSPGARVNQHILVMGGGLGLGPIVEAACSLAAMPAPSMRITVVCGSNEALRRDLLELFETDARFHILGHCDHIPALMAGSDLLVTKPGGVTCSEALACGLPMLLLRPLPGHEEENAEFLARTGAGIVVEEAWAGETANRLLTHKRDKLLLMRDRAKLFGRPLAANSVAAQVSLLGHEPGVKSAVG